MMTDTDQRDWFNRYIDAQNRGDLAALAGFLAPDLHLTEDDMEYRSAQAVLDHYRQFQGRVRRTLTVLNYVDRPGRIAAEIRTTLEAPGDAPDFPDVLLDDGGRRSVVSFVFHDIADGRFIRIRSAPCKAAP